MLISLKQYALEHHKSMTPVKMLALSGRFKTAQKIGRQWIIDSEEKYPEDQRKYNGENLPAAREKLMNKLEEAKKALDEEDPDGSDDE